MENLTGGTPPVRPLPCVVPCKLYFAELEETEYEEVFIDGTKIESMANRYTFVWKTGVEKNLAKLKEKAKVVFNECGGKRQSDLKEAARVGR